MLEEVQGLERSDREVMVQLKEFEASAEVQSLKGVEVSVEL